MIIIEYGHKYMDELLEDNLDSYKNKIKVIIDMLVENKENIKFMNLLDDIHIKEKKFNISDYKEKYELDYCGLDVHLESEMQSFAENYFNKIKLKCKKEFFRKSNKYVYFYVTKNNKKIAIKEEYENYERYYCVFLSYIWNLYKLKGTENTKLLNILENEFRDIEENVKILLQEINGYNNLHCVYIS